MGLKKEGGFIENATSDPGRRHSKERRTIRSRRRLRGWIVVSGAIARVLVGLSVKRRRRWARAVAVLKEFEEACATPVGRLRQVVDPMAVEMHAGLASSSCSKLKM